MVAVWSAAHCILGDADVPGMTFRMWLVEDVAWAAAVPMLFKLSSPLEFDPAD